MISKLTSITTAAIGTFFLLIFIPSLAMSITAGFNGFNSELSF